MNTPIYYTEEDLTFIKANCHLYTMQEMVHSFAPLPPIAIPQLTEIITNEY